MKVCKDWFLGTGRYRGPGGIGGGAGGYRGGPEAGGRTDRKQQKRVKYMKKNEIEKNRFPNEWHKSQKIIHRNNKNVPKTVPKHIANKLHEVPKQFQTSSETISKKLEKVPNQFPNCSKQAPQQFPNGYAKVIKQTKTIRSTCLMIKLIDFVFFLNFRRWRSTIRTLDLEFWLYMKFPPESRLQWSGIRNPDPKMMNWLFNMVFS